MTTIQEQLQRKRCPIDTWDIKEKLLLASAVVRSGDQNWMSVSRLLKTMGHASRPSDWYSQKNCAAQYGLLLENVETPKRKKRSNEVIETPSESILRRLRYERMGELKRIMAEERKLYMTLKEEINMVKSGYADEAQLREMCIQIEQENKQKEKEAQMYAEWLKQREEKKMELERQWRPKLFPQKRKVSDEIDPEEVKAGTSPLLTSLLKSPSPAPILCAQRTASPTIASLLNSSPEVNVSPSLQHLVSSAINEPMGLVIDPAFLPGPLPNLLGDDLKKDVPLPDNIEEEMSLIEEVIKNVEENEKELLERKTETQIEIDQNKIGEIKNELDKTLGTDECPPHPPTPPVPIVIPAEPEIIEPPVIEILEEPKPETPIVEEVIEPEPEPIKEDVPQESPKPAEVFREVSVILEDIDPKPTPEEKKEEIIEESKPLDKIEEEKEEESSTPPNVVEEDLEIKSEVKEEIEEEQTIPTLTDESDFDESSLVKTEKVKRDYSRNKKNFLEEKIEIDDLIEDLDEDKKLKQRSESPWTEDELLKRSDSIPNSPASSLEDDFRAWKKSVMLVYNRLSTHKYSSLFLKPITEEQAPGYHNLIYEPRDLQTLRRNIDSGMIKTTSDFIRYVLLMFQNAIMFNKTNSYVYKMAREMQQECLEHIQILVQAQAQIEMPRRETRTSETVTKTKSDLVKSRKRKAE